MEQLKKALKTLVKLASDVMKDVADNGKIDVVEIPGLVIDGIGFIGIFKNINTIKEELKAFDPDVDVPILVEEFKADFDLPDDVLEQKIEAGLDVIAKILIMVHEQ